MSILVIGQNDLEGTKLPNWSQCCLRFEFKRTDVDMTGAIKAAISENVEKDAGDQLAIPLS